MKSKKLARLCAVALALTLATTSLMSGTLARYTTTVSGTDTVSVARFGYETNDGTDDVEYTTGDATTIDLFDDLTTDATGTVKADTDDQLYLAPGVYGSFQIEMNALYADVDVEMLGSTVEVTLNEDSLLDEDNDAFLSYTITYTTGDSTDDEASQTAPIADFTYTVERDTVNGFAAALEAALASIVLEKNHVGVLTVEYSWVDTSTKEGDDNFDAEDTALGMKWAGDGDISDGDYTEVAAPTVTLTITNVASQVVTASETAPSYTIASAETDEVESVDLSVIEVASTDEDA